MNEAQVISDEVLEKVEMALIRGENWMTYNGSLYFIDKEDIQFFKDATDAYEFAANNFSDHDQFDVMHISSVQDLFRKIPYDLEERMQTLNWARAFYDPLEANTEAETLSDKDQFNRLEKLVEDLRHVYHSGERGKELVENLTTKYWKDHPIEEQKNYLLNKINVMNEQNLDYLKGNIKLTGFGENLNAELEKNLKEGKEGFQLFYKNEFNKKPFEATLNFSKSKETDMYFFNSYHASLQRSNGEKVEQTFHLNKGKGITAKEAFNLLDGRSVHKQLTPKEGEPYHAWIKLDFEKKVNNNFEVKQFHENYGYDLKAAVSKYAVAELNTPDKEKSLMESLQRGNVQSVTIDKNGSPEKMFIEANPQYKSVTLYDGHMKRVPKENVEQYQSKGQAAGQEAKQEVKQETKEDVKKKDNKQDITKDSKQKNSLLPKKQNTNGLLQKNRTSTKKGLAMG